MIITVIAEIDVFTLYICKYGDNENYFVSNQLEPHHSHELKTERERNMDRIGLDCITLRPQSTNIYSGPANSIDFRIDIENI